MAVWAVAQQRVKAPELLVDFSGEGGGLVVDLEIDPEGRLSSVLVDGLVMREVGGGTYMPKSTGKGGI